MLLPFSLSIWRYYSYCSYGSQHSIYYYYNTHLVVL